MTRLALVVLGASLAWPGLAADLGLDRTALAEALAIGQSRTDGVRDRFHALYRLPVGVAPVDYVEIVTPFRAVVLAAEARARAGDRRFGLKEAQETYVASGDETVVHVELTFHPQNTFVGVPGYDVALEAGPVIVRPSSIARIPRFGPRVGGGYPQPASPAGGSVVMPGPGQPLTGGTLVCRLPAGKTDPRGRYELVVRDGTRQLARVPLDFARVR